MKITKILSCCLLVLALISCNRVAPHYRIIQQGNLLDQEQIEQLQIGMSKEQVIDIMGSPVLTDTFDLDRWEYVYTLEEHRKVHIIEEVIIKFSNNTITSIEQNQ